jgi:ferric-dicitrate binding protein FerR (iron transport regulator)
MRDRDGYPETEIDSGDDTPDDDVRSLMRAAGYRKQLPADARVRVYAAAAAAFDALPDPVPAREVNRSSSKRWPLALAAGLFVLLGTTAVFYLQQRDTALGPVPRVAEVLYSTGDTRANNQQLASGDELFANAVLDTGMDGRLQLRLQSGVEVRADGNARFQITGDAELRLLRGRLYFDTDQGGHVRVHTQMGDITDIGTQFVVEYQPLQMNVAVREGAVRIEQPARTEVARAQPGIGERLHFTPDGLQSREPLDSTDPYWQWIGTARAEIQLGNGSVDDYLRLSARECGLDLSYVDPVSQQAAKQARLHGTTVGSGCIVAIDEVLQTTRLRRVSPDSGHRLVVGFD